MSQSITPAAPALSSPGGSATPSTTVYSSSVNHDTTLTNGVASGNDGLYNGDAESSKMAAQVDPTIHALNLSSWIYHVGYSNQDWADIQLTFFGSGLKAHRIVLARSPYLAHLLLNVVPGSTIHLSFVDENITEESVHIALQHLYNPCQRHVSPSNSRSVLATAFLLGGMPELVHHAYTICRDTLDSTNINEYVNWIGSSSANHLNGFRDASTMYGSVKVQDGQATVQRSSESEGSIWAEESHPRYGEWTIRLKHDIADFLLRVLPEQIGEEGKSLTNDPRLLSTYVNLPYDLFKSCVESPDLPIPSMQDRFQFAKKVLVQRKKLTSGASASASASGPPMEESVVLAFSGGDGMEVHVTRKPKKTRALWKVEG
ncbi:hypothetical protein CI109_101047 [Kwoniella shandongensis]|uniref:Uncharacterized protein n=1 Tax=Kwoniella shandongensis TaxID=1734106 RepID=A0A5M6C5Q8_9TREE|nr:uncharacterized protein CI109_001516 [Kwoniella shandongensis]KAA5530111.1 hypothetical protein CI109_001516 [Kwoniella shandongensis]